MFRVTFYTYYFFILSFTFYPLSVFAEFSFSIISDQRQYSGSGVYDSSSYFRGAIEAINSVGAGAFIISPGDIDPPEDSLWTIRDVLGSDIQWYPVVGNHELPGRGAESSYGANMAWLRSFDYDINSAHAPNIVNSGPSGCPETTFSFDYENSHFVILNEYCDISGDTVTNGDIPDHLYDWLRNDLANTVKEHLFVFGHEPAYPQPDEDNGRERHMYDSLNTHPENRDRFWALLRQSDVAAYFCGHTHNFSAVKLDGIWQIDSGHGRGEGDMGAPSTFVKIHVSGKNVSLTAYRDNHDGTYDYGDIVHRRVLVKGFPWEIFLPMLKRFQ